ncbi:MAG: TIGR01212 family radical SAM protein [Gemmatimonadota bacterium]|nr:TIGR01212 family radical SAM protein [Gemmatimonadota bacterium]
MERSTRVKATRAGRTAPPFPPGGKRYYSFNSYLKEKFGCRVHRVSVDAGFSCPNRDGTTGTAGCIFCSNEGFSFNTGRTGGLAPVAEQLESGIRFMRKRFRAQKFIAYFQAFSSTYAPPEELKKIYDNIKLFPNIVGLFIGTRPDCVPDEVLDLIASYRDGEKYLTWIEYGLQSARDDTLRRIGRGHTVADFTDAAARTRERGIGICAHVILGLPGETRQDMLSTAGYLCRTRVDGVKLHALHVLKGTPLAEEYARRRVELPDLDDYACLACDFLERLDSGMVVMRLAPSARPSSLVAPAWCASTREGAAAVEAEMERRNSWQGKLLGGNPA